MTKENMLVSIGLGRPQKLFSHTPMKIVKQYKLNKSYEENFDKEKHEETQKEMFVSTEIDTQEVINSVHKTTFDYLLSHEPSSPRVKNTMERLASRAKGTQTGILYDSLGRKITTKQDAIDNKIKLQEELILHRKLQTEKESVAQKNETTVSKNDTPPASVETDTK